MNFLDFVVVLSVLELSKAIELLWVTAWHGVGPIGLFHIVGVVVIKDPSENTHALTRRVDLFVHTGVEGSGGWIVTKSVNNNIVNSCPELWNQGADSFLCFSTQVGESLPPLVSFVLIWGSTAVPCSKGIDLAAYSIEGFADFNLGKVLWHLIVESNN